MRAKTATSLTSLFCFAILLSAVSNVGHCQNSWGSSGGYSSSGGRVVYVTSHHATPVRNLLARAHQRVHGHLHSTGSVGSWGSSGGSSGGASWGSSGGSSGGASWGSSGGASWGSSGGQVIGAPGYGALPTTQVPTPPEEQDEEVAQEEEPTEKATEEEQSPEAEYKDGEEDDRSFDEEADEVDEAHEESTNSTRNNRTLVANRSGAKSKSDVDEFGLSSDFYLKAAKVHRALEQKRVADSDSETKSDEIKKTVARK